MNDLICRVCESALGEEEHAADFFYESENRLYPICKFHYDQWIHRLLPESIMVSFDDGWDLWDCQCVLEE